ncbi:hypothetical protein UlMin_042535 [Ulmus minor]
MSVYDAAFVNSELSKPILIFGLQLWVVIGILVGSLIILTLFLLSICITSHHRTKHKSKLSKLAADANTPAISMEIQEIVHHPQSEIQVEIRKPEHRVMVFSDRASSGASRGTTMSGCETVSFGSGNVGPEVLHLGWGRWYTLRELEAATNGLCPKNVIGEGGYGIVYSGILGDGTKVSIKNLLNNRGQAKREFKVEVEVIRRVRHKNLVRLLGYCVKGAYSHECNCNIFLHAGGYFEWHYNFWWGWNLNSWDISPLEPNMDFQSQELNICQWVWLNADFKVPSRQCAQKFFNFHITNSIDLFERGLLHSLYFLIYLFLKVLTSIVFYVHNNNLLCLFFHSSLFRFNKPSILGLDDKILLPSGCFDPELSSTVEKSNSQKSLSWDNTFFTNAGISLRNSYACYRRVFDHHKETLSG